MSREAARAILDAARDGDARVTERQITEALRASGDLTGWWSRALEADLLEQAEAQ